ncbi:MAG: hypothetical protein JSS14_22050 [Proteobacteria bacterium]|nr:hypothetical protein [Pseudomonadota bacterium]
MTDIPIPTLSTGQPSTIGNWLDLCKAFGFKEGVIFFEDQLAKAGGNRDEGIIQHESQVMYLIATLESKARKDTA